MNNNTVRTIILALAVALFGFTVFQFRMILFKQKTLNEVLHDPKTYITGILGIILYFIYNHLIDLTIHHY